ncbi:ribitol-5-phosphate transferase FKTN-like [Saccoglossus kowalevskii]
MSKEALLFRNRVRTLLLDAKKVFDRLGIRVWLGSGTLLGWFRECDTMKYTSDVDVEMWAKDYDPRIIQTFQDAGFCLRRNYGKPEFGLSMAFIHNVGIKLDVYFDYESNNHTWYLVSRPMRQHNYQQIKGILPRFTICWTEFLEMKISVPCETESYIEQSYGKQWTQRIQEWDSLKSPPNLVGVGIWNKTDSMMFESHRCDHW